MTVNLYNSTDYSVFGFEHQLLYKRRFFIVIVKQTWRLMPKGGMRLVKGDDKREVRTEDEFVGGVLSGAVHLPNDLIPYKPHSEVVLTGVAQNSSLQQNWLVKVEIGKWSKTLKAYGPRHWKKGLTGWTLLEAEKSDRVTLNYSSAFGGSYQLPPSEGETTPLVVSYPKNSGGTGWLGKGHGYTLSKEQEKFLKDQVKDIQLLKAPSFESTKIFSTKIDPTTEIEPLAFGAFTAWAPQRVDRLSKMKPIPDDQEGYPDDFNKEFWQQTASDQWLPDPLEGSELITFKGVFPEGEISYRLPKPSSFLFIEDADKKAITFETEIDTVVIDADKRILEVVERRLVSLDDFGDDLTIHVIKKVE